MDFLIAKLKITLLYLKKKNGTVRQNLFFNQLFRDIAGRKRTKDSVSINLIERSPT